LPSQNPVVYLTSEVHVFVSYFIIDSYFAINPTNAQGLMGGLSHESALFPVRSSHFRASYSIPLLHSNDTVDIA
ncbi:MAG: hypothetical protein IIT98_05440, partial [Kiritimatiellae bacterium]|nr:hypothetical protein [Kiritimatiellia bacterium]